MMNSVLNKTIFVLGLLACMSSAQAGSPDGLSLAVIPSETALPYAGMMKQFLADARTHTIKCGENRVSLENVYIKNVPPQLTSELALGAVHDKAKRKQLGKILTGYRNGMLDHGFDAALVYEVKEGKLRLIGLSGAADEKPLVATLPVDAANDQQQFNMAGCKAVAELPSLGEI
jgi:hypothetical protein